MQHFLAIHPSPLPSPKCKVAARTPSRRSSYFAHLGRAGGGGRPRPPAAGDAHRPHGSQYDLLPLLCPCHAGGATGTRNINIVLVLFQYWLFQERTDKGSNNNSNRNSSKHDSKYHSSNRGGRKAGNCYSQSVCTGSCKAKPTHTATTTAATTATTITTRATSPVGCSWIRCGGPITSARPFGFPGTIRFPTFPAVAAKSGSWEVPTKDGKRLQALLL